ncbi:MAG TPA: AmmeMemoRadiSam system protein A [Thermoanaerobaculia bacterium]
MLTREQQTTLLRIARDSIGRQLDGAALSVNLDEYDEVLRQPAGAFVTLKRDGELRGCIGSVVPVDPVCRAVARSAVNAAFRDPRFYPLQREEFSEVHLEISVMGPIVPVTSIEEIVCGRDGLIIRRGGLAGLLLPQVAVEYGWDRETFLRYTCSKAGLDSEAWHDSATRIERFSAEVFSE